mmetsp:Transcript_30657/g.52656  ORF Transcript_30657/g.52656 Transcript_30657/m.52656 type:complete len:103 (-) Transcript_30657:576-884(-)
MAPSKLMEVEGDMTAAWTTPASMAERTRVARGAVVWTAWNSTCPCPCLGPHASASASVSRFMASSSTSGAVGDGDGVDDKEASELMEREEAKDTRCLPATNV